MLLHRTSPFNQSTAMAPHAGHSVAATDGACHNFTIEWLRLMLTGSGPATTSAASRMASLGASAGGASAILQKTYSEVFEEPGGQFERADRAMIALRGLREERLVVNYRNFDQAELTGAILSPEYAGFIYSFWYTAVPPAAGGGHTIGFFREVTPRRGRYQPVGTDIHAFDPNFGEYLIPEAELVNWFSTYQACYGTFNQHMLKSVAKN